MTGRRQRRRHVGEEYGVGLEGALGYPVARLVRVPSSDWVQPRRCAFLNRLTDFAVTSRGGLGIANPDAARLDPLNTPVVRFLEAFKCASGIPSSMISTNFERRDMIDRRTW